MTAFHTGQHRQLMSGDRIFRKAGNWHANQRCARRIVQDATSHGHCGQTKRTQSLGKKRICNTYIAQSKPNKVQWNNGKSARKRTMPSSAACNNVASTTNSQQLIKFTQQTPNKVKASHLCSEPSATQIDCAIHQNTSLDTLMPPVKQLARFAGSACVLAVEPQCRFALHHTQMQMS
jgi:hypothetical protein